MQKTDLSGFSDVDRTVSPEQFVQFLDAVNAWPFFRDEQKPRSVDLLDVQLGQHILDVGCGLGDVTRTVAAKVGPQGRVVGVDLSEVLIAVARQRTPPTDPVEFHVGDAARLAWSDASFDGSRADRILMFMEQPHQAVREMVRVTRPGGRIVVGEFDMETAIVDSPYRALTRKILDFWCDTIPNGWIGRQLLGLFQELGLRNVRVVPLLMRLTAYAQWNDVFQIETTVRRAVRGNVVSADEAEMWLRNLHEQDVRGRFCLCVSLFLVVGEKG